jgi:hypothetical protein
MRGNSGVNSICSSGRSCGHNYFQIIFVFRADFAHQMGCPALGGLGRFFETARTAW